MSARIRLFIITLSASAAISCFKGGEQKHVIRKFYFPYASFIEPKIYFYKSNEAGNASEKVYWYMRTVIKQKDTVFYTCTFDGKFVLLDTMTERITKKGSELIGYSFFDVRHSIKNKDVFLWKQELNQPIYFSYETPDGDRVYKKKRTLIETGKVITYNGKSYSTIEFSDYFKSEDGNAESSFTRTSTYAEGIGLVKFVNETNEGAQVFTLDKIYSDKEWNKLKN